MYRRLIIFISVLLLSALSYAQDLEKLTVDGKTRTMMVYEPNGLGKNPPLVISLHGAGQDAAYQRNQTHWNDCADTAKCVVVYPNAINNFWDVYGTSDIHFLEVVMDKMYERFHIDRTRIYITGFSLGAMMTYHCIEHLGDKVAAFGPVSGVRFDNKAPTAPRCVPIIHTHGTGDNVFWWNGDMNHAAGGYPSIPEYVEKWATYEGLDIKEVESPYPSTKPNSLATMTTWRKENDSIEVKLLAIKDKGHWHSEDLAAAVSTTQEIWKFCKRYTLGPVEPEPPSLLIAEPEDLSFDLPTDFHTFIYTFDGAADKSSVKARLENDETKIDLQVIADETENPNILTFIAPEETEIAEGDYKLRITEVKNPEGGESESYTFGYTFGYTEIDLDNDELFDNNPSPAYLYKGNFLRLMREAQWLYDATEESESSACQSKRRVLKSKLDKYADFASTAPSAYTAAMETLKKYMQPLYSYTTAIDDVMSDNTIKEEYYDILGRKTLTIGKGIYIHCQHMSDGTIRNIKRIYK